ncbi:MAG TPA: hypothetical protein VFI27_21495 [candidate division Zixibacteria bacterium]|nr:hypothetical protein [candidate division Zixibacteria bacterium]
MVYIDLLSRTILEGSTMRRAVFFATLLLVIASFVFAACEDVTTSPSVPRQTTPKTSSKPTNQQISGAMQELSGWAEGRWISYDVFWSADNNKVVLSVLALLGANSTAVNGYCGILRDVARDFFAGFNVTAGVGVGDDITFC